MIERYEIEICRNSGIGDKSALLAAWIAAVTLLSLVPIEQSQAQLILTIHPLQDHTNNTTLWIFSGSSTSHATSAQIRNQASLNTDNQDTWQIDSNNGNIFDGNNP